MPKPLADEWSEKLESLLDQSEDMLRNDVSAKELDIVQVYLRRILRITK